MKKEVEDRTFHLSIFNTNEPIIERSIKKYKIELENPITLARKKYHELEEFFTKSEKEYYTGTMLISTLNDYLLISLAESIESLAPVLDFENAITYFSYRIPFIKNPYLKAYKESLQRITEIAINENLSQIFGKLLTKEEFMKTMPFLARELVELGYEDLAKSVLIDGYKIIEAKESTSASKPSQKAIKN